MKNSYITKGLALALLAGSLSFGCSNKSNKDLYMPYSVEQGQNKQDSILENKIDTINNSSSEKKDSAIYHIIQKGDNYRKLADKYWQNPKDEWEIERLNPGVNPDKLQIGQKIRVK